MQSKPKSMFEAWTDLVRLEPCEAEHANLVNDVLPVTTGSFFSQTSHQFLSHCDDSVCHSFHFSQPIKYKSISV